MYKYFKKKIESLDDLNHQYALLRIEYRLPEDERGIKRGRINCADPGNTPWYWAGEKLSPEAVEIGKEYLELYPKFAPR